MKAYNNLANEAEAALYSALKRKKIYDLDATFKALRKPYFNGLEEGFVLAKETSSPISEIEKIKSPVIYDVISDPHSFGFAIGFLGGMFLLHPRKVLSNPVPYISYIESLKHEFEHQRLLRQCFLKSCNEIEQARSTLTPLEITKLGMMLKYIN